MASKGKHVTPKNGIGFTNLLAVMLVLLLAAGMVGGFVLGWRSITHQYTGALVCYTVVFTPIGTACSIVLGAIVKKSENENTGPNNEGVKYMLAMQEMQSKIDADIRKAEEDSNVEEPGVVVEEPASMDSPPI